MSAPATKTDKDEDFPVASLVLPPRLRAHILAYYRFARTADDIADSPDIEPEDKIARLDAMAASLRQGEIPLARSFRDTGVPPTHALELLDAFRWDSRILQAADWQELMDYCRLSAMPVGRFLLDLHGESRDTWPASDALCAILQIHNHIKDCGADYRLLRRVYVPTAWLAEEGLGVEALGDSTTGAGLRRIFDRMLDGCDRLMETARTLPRRIRHRSLRIQAAATLAMADTLGAKLRRADPLARDLALTTGEKFGSTLRGLLYGWVSH